MPRLPTTIRPLLVALLSLWLALPRAVAADGETYLVLGVIASGSAGQGVALLKSLKGGQAFAVRAGEPILQNGQDLVIERITRDYVFFRSHGHIDKIRVGEQLTPSTFGSDATATASPITEGVERQGNTVKISSELREHIVKRQLSQVLMQAGAIPYYINGELVGFRLWDIDAGSIYEKVGFANGDIITAINGQHLSDVGMAIRTLQALKDEPSANVTFIRQGVEQTVQIVIQ